MHGGCVAGDLVDDGRRTTDHEDQADACLHSVAQVSEQECGYQPDHEDADRERISRQSTNEIPRASSRLAPTNISSRGLTYTERWISPASLPSGSPSREGGIDS